MFRALRPRSEQAFTLIELLVVILIIGILLAVALPSFLGQVQKAANSSVQQQLSVTRTELKLAWEANGENYCPPVTAATAGSDPENDCTASVVATLTADEPGYHYVVSSEGADNVAVNTISIKLLNVDDTGNYTYTDADAEVAQACEESASNVVFCFQVNELSQDTQLNDPSLPPPADVPVATDEIYGAACVTSDSTGGDAIQALEQDQTTPSDYYYISNGENTNQWSDAPADCPAATTTAEVGNTYSDAVLHPADDTTPTPWQYLRLQEDPTTTNGLAADSANGRTGEFASTVAGDSAGDTVSGPTDDYQQVSGPGTITGEHGWALQGPFNFDADTNSEGDVITGETNGDVGPAPTATASWTLEGWVKMSATPPPNGSPETDIVGAFDSSNSDESVAITADANGVPGQLGFYEGEYCADGSQPGDGGQDGSGNDLCGDGSLPLYPNGIETTIGAPITTGSWVYVAATFNDPSDPGEINFYVNGSLAQSWTPPSAPLNTYPTVTNVSDLSGGTFYNDPVPSSGTYDPTGISTAELAVYTGALTSTQLQAHYSAAG